jgi:beta-phosphoglucomutase-like phosphatase (HAD superfamily)
MLEIKNRTYGELLAQFGVPYVGAVEFVKDLSAQYNLADYNAIASTATGVDVRTFLGMTGLKSLFPDNHIIALEDVTHPKPHPEAFDKAFLSLNLPDEARPNVLAFEDDPRGMLSAKKAGLTVCAITTRYSRKFLNSIEIRPDFIADSFAEFRGIFIFPPLPE